MRAQCHSLTAHTAQSPQEGLNRIGWLYHKVQQLGRRYLYLSRYISSYKWIIKINHCICCLPKNSMDLQLSELMIWYPPKDEFLVLLTTRGSYPEISNPQNCFDYREYGWVRFWVNSFAWNIRFRLKFWIQDRQSICFYVTRQQHRYCLKIMIQSYFVHGEQIGRSQQVLLSVLYMQLGDDFWVSRNVTYQGIFRKEPIYPSGLRFFTEK